jgi:hypothetical protein
VSKRPRLDLDQQARELTGLLPGWADLGITAGQLAWRDALAAWPQPIVTDRAAVAEPESVGVTLTAANANEARLVIWRGGWADVDLLLGPTSSPALLTSTTPRPVSPWLNPWRHSSSSRHDLNRKTNPGCVAHQAGPTCRASSGARQFLLDGGLGLAGLTLVVTDFVP